MRAPVDAKHLAAFMESLAYHSTGSGTVYLTGGATAVLLAIRSQTIDIDLKLDPEPKGAFEAIAGIKEQLGINVELAAPDDFIPALPDWRERSEFLVRFGQIDYYHYDFYSQALSKVLRGHDKDMGDALALVRLGKVELPLLCELFGQIKPQLIRYPSIDPTDFEARVNRFVKGAAP